MKQQYINDNFLARWIENDLSPQELEDFKNSKDYHQFNKINEASKLLEVPNFNNEQSFKNITNVIFKKKKTSNKVFKLSSSWMYSAAASILILISIFYFNSNNTENHITKYGEQITIKLPDNSIAYLSPSSKIEYSKKNWAKNRNLSLTGKAFFEVEKGETFTVNTNQGSVTVLGTKFTVNAEKNFFEVQCYEGKVKVISKNKFENILTKGKAFRVFNNTNENWNFTKQTPTWISGESEFNNTPLYQVITSLEKQFNLTFNTKGINIHKRFTGTFTHSDPVIALTTVFAPMKISFKLAENSSVLLTNN